jgi:hypothetical protein
MKGRALASLVQKKILISHEDVFICQPQRAVDWSSFAFGYSKIKKDHDGMTRSTNPHATQHIP